MKLREYLLTKHLDVRRDQAQIAIDRAWVRFAKYNQLVAAAFEAGCEVARDPQNAAKVDNYKSIKREALDAYWDYIAFRKALEGQDVRIPPRPEFASGTVKKYLTLPQILGDDK